MFLNLAGVYFVSRETIGRRTMDLPCPMAGVASPGPRGRDGHDYWSAAKVPVTGGTHGSVDKQRDHNNGFGRRLRQPGNASGDVVVQPGELVVYNGGTIADTVVALGGETLISAGGSAIGTTVQNGGEQFIRGGTATATLIASGGNELPMSGGVTSGAIVSWRWRRR